MRALKILIIVTSSIMVAFLLWNLTLSPEYGVTVEQEIQAEPSVVADEVSNLDNWQKWATYLQRDSTKSISYSTPSTGANAWVEWKLKDQSGGRLEFRSIEDDRINFVVSLSNFSAVECTMRWESTGNGTSLIWEANGELPFFARFAKGRFKDMIAADFKTTLENLAQQLN